MTMTTDQLQQKLWLIREVARKSTTSLGKGIYQALEDVIASGASTVPAPASTGTASVPTPNCALGAYVDGSAYSAFSTLIERPLANVLKFYGWKDTFTVPTDRETLITWEPWYVNASGVRVGVPLDRIASGLEDAVIQSHAAQLAAIGKPVYLRFAHEMNQGAPGQAGNWYPWGGQPTAYIAAWRHVRDLFRAAAPNVKFVWCANFDLFTPPKPYWPDPEYVDMIGIDGYNFGNRPSWLSPIQVIEPVYSAVAALDPTLPIWICETACAEATDAARKGQWITDLGEYLSLRPRIKRVYWFHTLKERDWRVDSSPASLTAFRALGKTLG